MVQSPLSFSATEQFRKKLMASNLEPYFVVNSKTPDLQKGDVGTKETNWIEVPLINQKDLVNSALFEKTKLNVINQYGPEDGFGSPYSVFLQTGKPNQGEFNFRTDNTNKFVESRQEQKNLIVLNQFGPQDGWGDGASQLENSLTQYKIRDEYFNYTPSTYRPGDILLELDPTGSDGALSQDSSLAQISAKKLKSLFEESIAFETFKLTTGRANALNAINDPYLALRIATGRASIIEPDFQLTVPTTVIGRGFDLISRITGVYSPYSYIPGDYFTQVKPINFLNQAVNFVGGLFGFPNVLPDRKSSSDVFLSYTGGGTRRKLFGLLELNKFAPDYRANFLGALNLNAPKGNYYIGNRTSEPLDIVSPSGFLPVDEYGVEIQSAVFGNGVLGDLYENETEFNFGLGSTTTIDGGGLQGGFTWVSPKYKGNAGFKVGQGGDQKGQDPNFPPLNAEYLKTESTKYVFKKGSILDDTQRIINSQPNGGKRLQHVGNAIDQVSKVFNDGYREMTKGSRVIRYADVNGAFRGEEYGRIFAKDIPYYEYNKLQKMDGNIRKNPYSILDKTYNLNIYPTTGPDSTTIAGGQVKKYMLSLENLAWRTSRRPGLRYTDLPETEKGPNGGRIMWFPPYDLSFSESNTVSWEGNEFLGRPEAIYTYRGTQRGGTLNFKVVVDHPSVMNLVVNRVLSNTGSGQLSDQILESFFAGLTKFDVYELAKRYRNFSQTELQQIQNIVNDSSNPERIKDTILNNLNKGGDGAGGSMESNATVGIQNYTPQLGTYLSSQFFFDYNTSGGNDYGAAVSSYQSNPQYQNINDEQKSLISGSYQNLENYCNSLNSLLSSNNNVVVTMKIKSSISYNETGALKQERNTCIEDTIKNLLTTLGTDLKRVNINKVLAEDDITIQPQNYKCDQQTTDNYGIGPVGCRRVIIDSIVEIPLPNVNNPNGGVPVNSVDVVDNLNSLNLLQRSLNEAVSSNNSNTTEPISKKVIRKLLNEGSYFEFLKENNPFVYDSLRQKLKYFHPAFHSTTPEGLNERLTFLLQCTRPGDTVPTKKSDGTFIDKDARNTSFGAPPVCVLRIGDFYNSKVIIDSVNFQYNDAKYDLNPEGIGVQPMIVEVSIGFKFIGGQSLRGPIEELQNALSFNFFANTEMYDERATALDLSAYKKTFIEKTEQTGDTPRNTNTNLQNEGGSLIGNINGDFGNSGTTANNSYKNVFNDLLEGYEKQTRGLYDKLNDVLKQSNQGALKLFTKQRSYKTGKVNGTDVNIFGKSEYVELVNQVFNDLISDINNTANPLTLIKKMSEKNFKENDQNKFRQQLVDLVNKTKPEFVNKFTTISNNLNESQYDLIRSIDKINYITQSLDGYIDKKGNAKIFDCQSGDTITELSTDAISICNSVNTVLNNFVNNKIITDDYNGAQTYSLLGNGFETAADKRFYLIFGYDLVNDYTNFEKNVLGTLDKTTGWKKFVSEDLEFYYRKPAVNENKLMQNQFKLVEKIGTKPNTVLPSDWNKLAKADRKNSLIIKTNPTDTNKKELQNLYLGYNSSKDDLFNGKVVF
jgi:hypothetical protein